MYQRHFLLLVILVTFMALTSDVTYAKNAVKATGTVAVSDATTLNDANTHRNLKTNAAIIDADVSASEERGVKVPSFLTKVFQRNPKVSNVVKNSPDVVKALKDPKVRQTVKELEGKKGLVEHFKSLPGIKNIAERLRTKSGPLTSTDVKELGAVAMKSSGTWKDTLRELWVKYGARFMIGLGILFFSAVVTISVFPWELHGH